MKVTTNDCNIILAEAVDLRGFAIDIVVTYDCYEFLFLCIIYMKIPGIRPVAPLAFRTITCLSYCQFILFTTCTTIFICIYRFIYLFHINNCIMCLWKALAPPLCTSNDDRYDRRKARCRAWLAFASDPSTDHLRIPFRLLSALCVSRNILCIIVLSAFYYYKYCTFILW